MNKNDGTMGPQGPRVQINPADLDDVVCSECGNVTFLPVLILKRVSALLSPTGKEQTISMPTFACNACGNVNPEFVKNIPFKPKKDEAAPSTSPLISDLKSPSENQNKKDTPPPFHLI